MRLVTENAEEINAIMNAPGCREEHFPPGFLENNPNARHDCQPVLDAGGFSIVEKGAGWLFNMVGVGTYEGHSAILPEYRGQRTLTYFDKCIDTAFVETDAMEIITRCPSEDPTTNAIAKRLRMNMLYTAAGIWGGGDMEVYSLPLSVWASKIRTRYVEKGKWLHEEFERNGSLHEDHEDDDTHFHYAGLAIEMGQRGNAPKGAHLYNLYAQMAGYDPIMILCLDPLVIRTYWRDTKDLGSPAEAVDYLVYKDRLERVES